MIRWNIKSLDRWRKKNPIWRRNCVVSKIRTQNTISSRRGTSRNLRADRLYNARGSCIVASFAVQTLATAGQERLTIDAWEGFRTSGLYASPTAVSLVTCSLGLSGTAWLPYSSLYLPVTACSTARWGGTIDSLDPVRVKVSSISTRRDS